MTYGITYRMTYNMVYGMTYHMTYPMTYCMTYPMTYGMTYRMTYRITHHIHTCQKTKSGKTVYRGLAPWCKDLHFCNSWIQQAARLYADVVGPPPVVTGVKSKLRAKALRAKGHTRGQMHLIKAAGNRYPLPYHLYIPQP